MGFLSTLVYFGLLWFVIAPLHTLLHELGHALTALALGADRAIAQVGGRHIRDERIVARFAPGPLEIRVCSLVTAAFVGFAWYHKENKPLSRQRQAWIALAGPLTSLTITVLAATIAYNTRDAAALVRFLAQGTAMVSFFVMVFTALPITYGPQFGKAYAGHPSDMKRVLSLLRQSNEDES